MNIETVCFSEHPVVDFTQLEPCSFDISTTGLDYHPSFVLNGAFNLEAYCEAILNKVIQLGRSEIVNFLNYHCNKLKEPCGWLDQLEFLIELNENYFDEKGQKMKAHKLYMNIQIFCENLTHIKRPLNGQHIDCEDVLSSEKKVKFDFDSVKFDLTKLTSYNQQKAYLIEIKANFLQSKKLCITSTNKLFATLIDIELEKIEKLNEIPAESNDRSSNLQKKLSNIRINGPSNLLIDIFYQLLYEIFVDGKPYIDNTPTEVANMIVDSFASREGKNLSLSSVQTTLSPKKADKRPSNDKRFSVNRLINPSLFLFNMYIIDYLNIIDMFPFLN